MAGFNDLMARLDHPMIVITTAAGGKRAGCLVGFHTQCSIDPPRYAMWLSKANHTFRVGALSEVFAVHFLADDDVALAKLFGTNSGDRVDKFVSCAWTAGPDGVPLLDGCANRFVGRRRSMWDDGSDHVCLVVEADEVVSAPFRFLPFSAVAHLDAGKDAIDRQRP